MSTTITSKNDSDNQDQFRDRLSTVDESGKRVWIYPKKPSGRYHRARVVVAIGLLVFLFGAPFVKIGGLPLILLDVLSRRFVFFGQLFTPQDFHLFVFATLLFIVFVVLFTVVFGRVFCGWVCPQTIFMEMVFRKVEYWIEGDFKQQQRLNKQPWNAEKIHKKSLKHFIFICISLLITHTFLAYIIGVEEVWKLFEDTPTQHLGLFTAFMVFTGLFYGVFAFFREQVCTNVCPYGRLQGVMLDNDSIVVAYDYERGEPRGKGRRKENDTRGDCVDCHQCVDVCPTGIDIRNGTQLECVNCTACIDACDHIMERFDLPKGLIRYDSINGIENKSDDKQKFRFTNRMKAYSVVLVLILSAIVALLLTRTKVEVIVTRAKGSTYQTMPDGEIRNMYTVLLSNKSQDSLTMELVLDEDGGTLEMIGENTHQLAPEEVHRATILIDFSPESLPEYGGEVKIKVMADGEHMETVKTKFLAPFKAN